MLRKNEINKTLKTTSKTELVESERPPIQNELADKVIEDPGGQSDSDRSHSDFEPAECVNRSSFHSSRSETDVETDLEQSKIQQPAEDKNSSLIGHRNDQSKSEGRNRQWEGEEAPFKKITERRVTWKHRQQSNEITKQDLLLRNGQVSGGHVEKNGISSQSMPSTSSSNKPLMTTSTYGASVETGTPHLDPYNDSQEIRRSSLCSQPEDDNGFLTESGRFIRNVKSPRLRRRNPNNLQPSIPSDSSKKVANGLELTPSTNSNGNQRRPSNPCIKVLKLGSLKNNAEALWNVPEKRSSQDPETLSEPEQTPDGNRQTKPKLKTQRSASIPEISSFQSSHRRSLSPPPGTDNQFHPSPLQDLLQRAKEREKGRGLGKRVGETKARTFPLQNSPISASPSPSASEGEREVEGENSAGPSMISPHGWIEGNVDGSEDEMKDR